MIDEAVLAVDVPAYWREWLPYFECFHPRPIESNLECRRCAMHFELVRGQFQRLAAPECLKEECVTVSLDQLVSLIRKLRATGQPAPDVLVIPAEDWTRLATPAGLAPDGLRALDRFSTDRDGRKVDHVGVENFTVLGVPVVAEGALPGIGLTEGVR